MPTADVAAAAALQEVGCRRLIPQNPVSTLPNTQGNASLFANPAANIADRSPPEQDCLRVQGRKLPDSHSLCIVLMSVPASELVQRAAWRGAETTCYVQVDHGGLNVGVTEQLLNLPNVHAVDQHRCGE